MYIHILYFMRNFFFGIFLIVFYSVARAAKTWMVFQKHSRGNCGLADDLSVGSVINYYRTLRH